MSWFFAAALLLCGLCAEASVIWDPATETFEQRDGRDYSLATTPIARRSVGAIYFINGKQFFVGTGNILLGGKAVLTNLHVVLDEQCRVRSNQAVFYPVQQGRRHGVAIRARRDQMTFHPDMQSYIRQGRCDFSSDEELKCLRYLDLAVISLERDVIRAFPQFRLRPIALRRPGDEQLGLRIENRTQRYRMASAQGVEGGGLRFYGSSRCGPRAKVNNFCVAHPNVVFHNCDIESGSSGAGLGIEYPERGFLGVEFVNSGYADPLEAAPDQKYSPVRNFNYAIRVDAVLLDMLRRHLRH